MHRSAAAPPLTLSARAWSFIIRNRVSIQDLTLVLLAVLGTAFVCLEIDVFVSGGRGHLPGIETDELPVIGAVLMIGLLVFAWRRLRELKRETRRRSAAERDVRKLAFRDPLTGLPNRRQFTEALRTALMSPPRLGAAHALLMLDLNGFKQVNDIHGHGAGDELLIVVAQRLLGAVREGDLVVRLGGDEFAILAEQLAGPEAATGLALRVIDALSPPATVANIRQEISSGIGICLFPFPDATLDEVMRRADVALYRAKADGKSSLRFFDAEMDQHIRERDQLERELKTAVARGDIRPFFQPLVDLRTKEIVGFEALARWSHPVLGAVPPDRFIPVAEDTGLIQELSESLLAESCRAALDWPTSVTLSFNISPVQLKEPTLGLRILAILARTGLPPSRLEIEITESALVRDLESARSVLTSLREAGVRLALDDFGTGYSSLYHLRNFKLDKIKIDRSFVSSMAHEHESAEIVSALVGLGHGLGLTITAEGVEGSEQEADLLARGCQQGQGYLFSQAVSAEEAVSLLRPGQDRASAAGQ
ncbi:putative bifunctional diguanylate cyclase/phosphodiesterase [Enterovirga aerilata]|uniref:EAL domain-containing protein n=1 Tax=Enterovirga aerilata TaxID=2730920 RepID=A0A849HV34_9HYPH|nr:EAL domain-containing protein [Enterovirga sp. DB1703]NNM71366.1 EAL domain-containing protein [Enterovirga sp. DB1703]